MKTFKARGIVLREYEAGESDKRLVLLCKELGRLTVYVRGARKPGSKFIAAAQLFTYADFVLADGRQFYAVTQAEVIESFSRIPADYDRLCAAQFALEVCEKTLLSNTPADELLLLVLKTLTLLNRSRRISPRQLGLVFGFRFFKAYGLAPETEVCCLCGEAGDAFFFCDEGLLCLRCAAQKTARTTLSAPAVVALRHMLHADLSEAFLFQVSDSVLAELIRAGKLFWGSHFQMKLLSADSLFD